MLRIKPQEIPGRITTDNDPFGDGSYVRDEDGIWMMGPRDNPGGRMSYYSGEVTGITQVVKLQHNLAAGRPLKQGLEHIPKEERLFDFGDPAPWSSRIRKIGRSLF